MTQDVVVSFIIMLQNDCAAAQRPFFFAGMIEKNQDSIIYDYVWYRFPFKV